jgi:hypothetical protein
MQACLYGHWKVVQILVLFKANVSEDQLFPCVFMAIVVICVKLGCNSTDASDTYV